MNKIPGFVYARIATEQPASRQYNHLGDRMTVLYKTINQGASAELRGAVSTLDEVIGEREAESRAAGYMLGLQDGLGLAQSFEPAVR